MRHTSTGQRIRGNRADLKNIKTINGTVIDTTQEPAAVPVVPPAAVPLDAAVQQMAREVRRQLAECGDEELQLKFDKPLELVEHGVKSYSSKESARFFLGEIAQKAAASRKKAK